MLDAVVTNAGEVEWVDVGFTSLPVNKRNAEMIRRPLLEMLATGDDGWLADGPSYIHLGAIIGDQGLALKLMAVGKVLGWWGLITPRSLGLEDPDDIERLAGAGYVMLVPGFTTDRAT